MKLYATIALGLILCSSALADTNTSRAKVFFSLETEALYLTRNGKTTRITALYEFPIEGCTGSAPLSPQLSPDGKAVMYVLHGFGEGISQGYALYLLPLTGKHRHKPILLRDEQHMPAAHDDEPSLSWLNNQYLRLKQAGKTYYFDRVGNKLAGKPKVR